MSVDVTVTGRAAFGSRADVQAAILSSPDPFYVYILWRPDGRPFYVGKGKALRLFHHEAAALGGDNSHKLNVIRAIRRDGGQVLYEIDAFFAAEEDAFDRERSLIAAIGRTTLTNLTDGGEGAANPAEEVKERHRITLGGIPDDGSDRSVVNRFFLGLGQHASIPVKPLSKFKPKPVTPHRIHDKVQKRQAVALAASAVANGVILMPGCRIPRFMEIDGVPSVMENGVCSNIMASGLAKVASDCVPGREVFVMDAEGMRYLVEAVGRDRLVDAGVLPE